jgi:hypothetical protein
LDPKIIFKVFGLKTLPEEIFNAFNVVIFTIPIFPVNVDILFAVKEIETHYITQDGL